MAYKDIYKMSDESATSLIFDVLYDNSGIRRKELIERCIASLGFSDRQMRESDLNSVVIHAKSRIGMLLSAALKSGYILESETGILTLVGSGKHIVSREKARDYIMALLLEQNPMTKRRIYERAEQDFGVAKTPDKKDDNDLRAVLGKVLVRLEEEKHIIKTASGYVPAVDRRYPNTEMGGCLREAANGGDLKACFLNAIHIRGGEWFEIYCVELLSSYYKAHDKTILCASVTGGSDDGGIDGIIKTEDCLGYRETVLMQMKNRHAVMSSKDVREFYGAVCAENGSRGVFITISSFHPEAWKLMNKVDNLIGIDGDKLFEIAKQQKRGIIEKNGCFVLDEKMFLEI